MATAKDEKKKSYKSFNERMLKKKEDLTKQVTEFVERNKDVPAFVIKELNNTLEDAKHIAFNSFVDKESNKINFEKVMLVAMQRIHNRANVKEVKTDEKSKMSSNISSRKGCLVSVRPCGEKYKDKTYLGFYLGDFALGFSGKYEGDALVLSHSSHNPAIFIPEVREIVYGCESWWSEIESEEQLRQITDDDIDNVWYVKALKEINE